MAAASFSSKSLSTQITCFAPAFLNIYPVLYEWQDATTTNFNSFLLYNANNAVNSFSNKKYELPQF